MILKFSSFILFFIFLLLPGVSSAEIFTQHFDSNGNLIFFRESRSGYPGSSSYNKFILPEGIELKKGYNYEFFPVFGKAFSDIIRSVYENGPYNSEARKRLPSKLQWSVAFTLRYDYFVELDEDKSNIHILLDINDIAIDYNITITLPALIDDTQLNPVEKTLWKNFFVKLLEYEYDHIKILEDARDRKEHLKLFSDINYIAADMQNEVDLTKMLNDFLRKESTLRCRDWIKKVNFNIKEYNLLTNFGQDLSKREVFFKQKESEIEDPK